MSYVRIQHDDVLDAVAVEEPLEIRVDGRPLSVTMRTPGHDDELALGFLYGEGLIDGPRPAVPTADFAANTIEVSGPLLRDPGERRFYTASSCGVCGKGALEQVAVTSAACWPGSPTAWRSRDSSGPAACTPPGSSPRKASRCSAARMSGATTQWTR
jgi:FdhD protein